MANIEESSPSSIASTRCTPLRDRIASMGRIRRGKASFRLFPANGRHCFPIFRPEHAIRQLGRLCDKVRELVARTVLLCIGFGWFCAEIFQLRVAVFTHRFPPGWISAHTNGRRTTCALRELPFPSYPVQRPATRCATGTGTGSSFATR